MHEIPWLRVAEAHAQMLDEAANFQRHMPLARIDGMNRQISCFVVGQQDTKRTAGDGLLEHEARAVDHPRPCQRCREQHLHVVCSEPDLTINVICLAVSIRDAPVSG